MRRRGFTLIEMLVVIGLVALLASMLVMAIGHMQISGKRQQTHGILANLSAMFADYDVNRRVPFGAGDLNPSIIAPLTHNLFMPCPQNVSLDYNTSAEAVSPMPSSPAPTADRKGLDGNWAVPSTRAIMAQMLATSSNSTAVGKLPASLLMTFAGFPPSAISTWSSGSTCKQVGEYWNDGSGNLYIRTKLNLDTSGNLQADGPTDGPPNYYYWTPALPVPNPTVLPSPPGSQGTLLPTPVLQDAWGNPIIFVMGGVLGADPSSYMLSTSPPGILPAGCGGMISGSGSSAIKIQVHSPDYHPFFASAGPDGDFSKGDDNLYSYEK